MYHFHIADDHPLFRSALLKVINQHFEEANISESSDLDSTLDTLDKNTDIDLLTLVFPLLSYPLAMTSPPLTEPLAMVLVAISQNHYLPKR